MKTLLRFVAAALMALACSESGTTGPGAGEEPVVVISPHPDDVPVETVAITGRVFDFLTDRSVGEAFISTFPPTELVRTNADGQYIVTQGIVSGRLYEVKAEAEGYARAVVPVRTGLGRTADVNLPLIPRDKAVPVRFEPPVVVLTGELQEAQVMATSEADTELELVWSLPPWLVMVGPARPLGAGEHRPVTFRLEPEAFRAALAERPEGASLQGQVELHDQVDRRALIQVVAVPAAPEMFDLSLDGPAELTLRAGTSATLSVSGTFGERPLVGAIVEVRAEGGAADALEAVSPRLPTDAEGRARFELRAVTQGTWEVSFHLAAWPDAKPVAARLRVVASDPCASDAKGINACGEARYWTCAAGEDALDVSCTDVAECTVADGRNACGEARFWRCAENEGAPPGCEDVLECADPANPNGACGDPLYNRCDERLGGPPTCTALDPCAAENGGCGDPLRVRCDGAPGGPPRCEAFEPCEIDENGDNPCGDARFWRCEALEDGSHACEDLAECESANGGCGNARFTRCLEQVGGPALCEDIDDCTPDADGRNACGEAAYWRCLDQVGAAPVCEDLDECARDNGGCGDRRFVRCLEVRGGPPVCEDLDECTVGADGRNACGIARLWICTDHAGGPPSCEDLDECAADGSGLNACGSASRWLCLNRPGAEPVCEDLDECAPDVEGGNGCGVARYWSCENREGAPPRCTDLDECAVDNGGCGDVARFTCTNRAGEAPLCGERDLCTPDAAGRNACGVADLWTCTSRPGQAPLCEDRDECAIGPDGRNACGLAVHWDCVNRLGLPPLCDDRDECALDPAGENACGIGRFWTCEDREGAPPRCTDIDECRVNNGGCGDPLRFTCTNNAGAAPTCGERNACSPDESGRNACGEARYWRCTPRPGLDPICEDLDECAADQDGINGCGISVRWGCTNRAGGPPTCVDRDECLVDAQGRNACGIATLYDCQDREGLAPLCPDRDECADPELDNGGCGDPHFFTCTNNDLAPPTCEARDPCEPSLDGTNDCGLPDFWVCIPRDGQAPLCVDRDECAPDAQGQNGCGIAARWNCTNNEGAPPDCEDRDECADQNGGCGDPTFTRCINEPGAAPRCVDLDECATNNGECGDPRFVRCQNNLGGLPPTCTDLDLCAPDAQGNNGCGIARHWDCVDTDRGPPECTDLDECLNLDGRNGCGSATEFLCQDNVGDAPTCDACPPDSHNLDGDNANGCEYSCAGEAQETCNSRDDNCDGRIDEGFDLLNDNNNCGGCGVRCANLPNTTRAGCHFGRCLVEICNPRWLDTNANPADGCEDDFVGTELWVNAASAGGDGSQARPYRTINDATLAQVPNPRMIYVAAGRYDENVVLSSNGTAIRGVGAEQVTIVPAQAWLQVVYVGGDWATISGVTLSGGRWGISNDNGNLGLTSIDNLRVHGVRILGQSGPAVGAGAAANDAAGIYIVDVSRTWITATDIANVRGGDSRSAAGVGAYGYGIRLVRAGTATLSGLGIDQITGGQGSAEGGYGPGGSAIGVLFDGSGGRLDYSQLLGVSGRQGRDWADANNPGSSTSGGSGRAVLLANGANGVTLDRVTVGVVNGGRGGDNAATMGVQPVGNGNHAMAVSVDNARTVNINRLRVETMRGGRGGRRAALGPLDGNGGSAYGLYVNASTDVTVTGLLSRDLDGGTTDATLGSAFGLYVAASTGVTVDAFTVERSGISGGPGRGVYITNTQVNPVILRNGIVARATGACVQNAAAQAALRRGYLDLFGCTGGALSGPMTDDGPILDFNPLFVNANAGDLHLAPNSPAIDAGDPLATYRNERNPNGCRRDLGAYGNTNESTPSGLPDVEHCP